MIRSSIDLGTNTCLLLIADQKGQDFSEIRDLSTVVRLGEGVDKSREFRPESMRRTLDCLKVYAEEVRNAGLDPRETICVATSQARDARNGVPFFDQVEKETGFRFQVISGEEEARLTFLGGLLPGMDPSRSAVIDIGGGSTEVIARHGGRSIDLGSVRFTERYLKSDPVTDGEFWACQDAVDEQLFLLLPWREKLEENTELIAVAGTPTTLAAWFLGLPHFDARSINEVILSGGDVHRMVEELKWRSVAERSRLPGMEPRRADVILTGALILWRAMELLRFPFCRVSTRGLRYGILASPPPFGCAIALK